MIKKISLILLALCVVGCTTQTVQPVPANQLPGLITSNEVPPKFTRTEWLKDVSPAERKALVHFLKTQQAETNQFIQYPFGRITPQITCSPLHTCDILLQAGEKITGVYPGDTARWLFEEAVSENDKMHVIFKPKDADIATNAIITTTKRTYHLDLFSKMDAQAKPISFYYPDDFLQSLQEVKDAAKAQREEDQLQQSLNKDHFNQLNFKYQLDVPLFGTKPRWVPVRVFNNGKQVYIEMPDAADTVPLPALFVVEKDGEPALVNFRIRKPYYIVDQLFDQAMLMSGVGRNQERVTIRYIGV
jgi:type IV secretion system protein VirB9